MLLYPTGISLIDLNKKLICFRNCIWLDMFLFRVCLTVCPYLKEYDTM